MLYNIPCYFLSSFEHFGHALALGLIPSLASRTSNRRAGAATTVVAIVIVAMVAIIIVSMVAVVIVAFVIFCCT